MTGSPESPGVPLAGVRVVRVAAEDPASRSAGLVAEILGGLGASLDVYTPAAGPKDVLAGADVLVVDGAGRAWLDACLDGVAVEQGYPRLVVVSATAFGLTGPWANRRGGELIVQAAAGVALSNGAPDDPPLPAGIPLAAMSAALLASVAVLGALLERARSGRGQEIEQAEFDAVVALSGTLLPQYFLTGRPLRRPGNRHTMAAPWNLYRCRDGWVVICTMNDTQFQTLCRTIDRTDLMTDPRFLTATDRVTNVEALDTCIGAWAGEQRAADALACLEAGGVAVAPVLSEDDVKRNHQEAEHTNDAGWLTLAPAPGGDGRHEFDPEGADCGWTPGLDRMTGDRRNDHAPDRGVLDGLRVVEFAGHTAGPMASRLLALLGADVIKVESPRGDAARRLALQVAGAGYLFHINNTDKRACTLDLATPHGAAQMRGLLQTADAFITNMIPATLTRLGIGPEQVCAANPRLVYGELLGFPEGSVYAGRPAFDMIVQSVAGVMSLTGRPISAPRKIALSAVDCLTGCAAAVGVLAGLVYQARTGHGALVTTSMLQVGEWATLLATETNAEDAGGGSETHGACLPAADGWVAISGPRDTIDAVLADHDRDAGPTGMPAEELARSLRAAGLAASRLLALHEVAEADQTAARQLIVQVSAQGERLRVLNAPFRFSRSHAGARSAAPPLGQDNALVLGDAPEADRTSDSNIVEKTR